MPEAEKGVNKWQVRAKRSKIATDSSLLIRDMTDPRSTTRRSFVRTGALGVDGLLLPDLLKMRSEGAVRRSAAENCES
jgi:hypothetical protein